MDLILLKQILHKGLDVINTLSFVTVLCFGELVVNLYNLLAPHCWLGLVVDPFFFFFFFFYKFTNCK